MSGRRGEPPRAIGEPEPGFFTLRLVKRGPEVAACIRLSFGMWSASINGAECGHANPDPAHAGGVYRVWSTGKRVDEAAYRALLAHPPLCPELPLRPDLLPPPF